MFWPFGSNSGSSGIFFVVQWRRFGPWYVRFQNNEPMWAYHIDDLRNPSTKDDTDCNDGWRYGA